MEDGNGKLLLLISCKGYTVGRNVLSQLGGNGPFCFCLHVQTMMHHDEGGTLTIYAVPHHILDNTPVLTVTDRQVNRRFMKPQWTAMNSWWAAFQLDDACRLVYFIGQQVLAHEKTKVNQSDCLFTKCLAFAVRVTLECLYLHVNCKTQHITHRSVIVFFLLYLYTSSRGRRFSHFKYFLPMKDTVPVLPVKAADFD